MKRLVTCALVALAVLLVGCPSQPKPPPPPQPGQSCPAACANLERMDCPLAHGNGPAGEPCVDWLCRLPYDTDCIAVAATCPAADACGVRK